MKKSLLALSIVALSLSACHDEKAQAKVEQLQTQIAQLQQQCATEKAQQQETLTQLQQSLANTAQSFPSLMVELHPIFDKKITHLVGENESLSATLAQSPIPEEISLRATLAQTQIPWLNQILRTNLYRYLTLNPTITEPTEKDLVESLNKTFEELKKSDGTSEESLTQTYVGQRYPLVTFATLSYSYGGGAHGLELISYLNIDIENQRLLNLEDVLEKNKKAKLKDLLWKNLPSDRRDVFIQFDDFKVSENFYFAFDGIHFVYPPYVIGPYSDGNAEITAYWYQLKENEIIKAKYFW